jgi:hypothetical protein
LRIVKWEVEVGMEMRMKRDQDWTGKGGGIRTGKERRKRAGKRERQ